MSNLPTSNSMQAGQLPSYQNPRPKFSPYDDVMNPVNKGSPFVPGVGRPPAPGNHPGQWSGPRPPHGPNGVGENIRPPLPAAPWGEGPSPNFNSAGPLASQTRPFFPSQGHPTNGSNMTSPGPPQNFIPNSNSASLQQPNTVINSQNGNGQGQADVLPVPFHGQGQYSHQVNPFTLKTPEQTPSNSAKTSRQPSPVPGSTIDALEGQFTSNSGKSSPSFSNASSMPNRYPVPTASPLVRPPVSMQAQTPPSFPLPPGQTSIPRPVPPMSQPNFSPQQPPSSQPNPSRPSFPPQPPNSIQPPHPGSNFPPQPPPSSQPPPPVSRFPPPTSSQPLPLGANFPPQPLSSSQPPPPGSRFPPPPSTQPLPPGVNFPPQPSPSSQHPPVRPGFPLPPPSSQAPPVVSGFLPPSSTNGSGGAPPSRFPPPPGANIRPGIVPPSAPSRYPQPGQGGYPNIPPTSQNMGMTTSGNYPNQPMPGYQNNVNTMTQGFSQMGIQESQRAINLLNERKLVPPEGVETARPTLPHDYKKVNCSPDVFRCTLNAIPQSSSLLTKARLPLGILIHPFRDLSQLPVIQSSVIVRCRSCRTYINPFVVFVDQRRWKCNLCFRVNELPEEFSFDPVTKTYGDPQRRPEVKSATIEFIAPSEYMLRPPQPAVYLYLLDVSFNAVETGYLSQFCQILLDELDKIPGDARTTVGFMCYDRTLYYFNLAEGLSQPQMLCVPDLEEPFLPCPDNLLVNLHESKELITELLNQLPTMFEGNRETGSALGAALTSAHKMMIPTGGRITIMQTCLPTVGPGALENRESSNNGKNVTNLGPATDFYKKLALDCSAQQIAVDLFMLNGQYADISSLSCISKYSAGSVYHYPAFHTVRTPSLVEKFDADLRRYLTRKIGFESVMRIRCTRGLSIHTFHGNFFVRSTDLLSLPNINPDAGFGMQMSIEDNLNESTTVSFQAALLYTSSKGERRIRVHTLCIPVTNQITEVFAAVDQEAVAALLAKMAVDRSLNSAISDARDAMINAPVDTLMAYSQQIPASQRVGALMAPYTLRLLPMYMLAMLKSVAFSLNSTTKTDERVFAMQQFKVQPVAYLLQTLYPHLYPLLQLSMDTPIKRGNEELPGAALLQLSSANVDRTGLFLMDCGESMYLLVGGAVGDKVCQDVFDQQNFMSIPDNMIDLPELDNPLSETIRGFVNGLADTRPNGITFLVIRDDSKNRHLFFQHMLEDRTENSMSYYEFLQFLQGKMK